MDIDIQKVNEITKSMPKHFRTFGGGQKNLSNSLMAALADEPLSFSLGVNVEDVVIHVMQMMQKTEPTVVY